MDKATLFSALRNGDLTAVRQALEEDPTLAGLRWAAEDGDAWATGATTLHAAIRSGNHELIQLLLDAGVDPGLEYADSRGRRNAAHEAYEYGGPDLCTLMLEVGAPYDIFVAAALGHSQRVETLLDDDPDLVTDMSTGLSPLGWAGYGQGPGDDS